MVALAAANQRQWAALCEVIDRADLREDPRFATNEARVSNRSALLEVLSEIFAERDADKWLTDLGENGLPCGPINTLVDVFVHPQADARELALEAGHPTVGPVHFPGFPYKLSQTPADVRQPPPTLGQHTEEVLNKLLGYDPSKVAELRESGAI